MAFCHGGSTWLRYKSSASGKAFWVAPINQHHNRLCWEHPWSTQRNPHKAAESPEFNSKCKSPHVSTEINYLWLCGVGHCTHICGWCCVVYKGNIIITFSLAEDAAQWESFHGCAWDFCLTPSTTERREVFSLFRRSLLRPSTSSPIRMSSLMCYRLHEVKKFWNCHEDTGSEIRVSEFKFLLLLPVLLAWEIFSTTVCLSFPSINADNSA